MGCGTGGTASSVLFCIALRCSPNLSLKARLVCPNKGHNYGSWSEVFRWCVWGAFTFTKLYHVNEIFIGTFDRLLDEVSLASVFECTRCYTVFNEGEGFTSDGVTFLYEKGVFEVGTFVCFSLPLIAQEDLAPEI